MLYRYIRQSVAKCNNLLASYIRVRLASFSHNAQSRTKPADLDVVRNKKFFTSKLQSFLIKLAVYHWRLNFSREILSRNDIRKGIGMVSTHFTRASCGRIEQNEFERSPPSQYLFKVYKLLHSTVYNWKLNLIAIWISIQVYKFRHRDGLKFTCETCDDRRRRSYLSRRYVVIDFKAEFDWWWISSWSEIHKTLKFHVINFKKCKKAIALIALFCLFFSGLFFFFIDYAALINFLQEIHQKFSLKLWKKFHFFLNRAEETLVNCKKNSWENFQINFLQFTDSFPWFFFFIILKKYVSTQLLTKVSEVKTVEKCKGIGSSKNRTTIPTKDSIDKLISSFSEYRAQIPIQFDLELDSSPHRPSRWWRIQC